MRELGDLFFLIGFCFLQNPSLQRLLARDACVGEEYPVGMAGGVAERGEWLHRGEIGRSKLIQRCGIDAIVGSEPFECIEQGLGLFGVGFEIGLRSGVVGDADARRVITPPQRDTACKDDEGDHAQTLVGQGDALRRERRAHDCFLARGAIRRRVTNVTIRAFIERGLPFEPGHCLAAGKPFR